jgi:hypothetical protein
VSLSFIYNVVRRVYGSTHDNAKWHRDNAKRRSTTQRDMRQCEATLDNGSNDILHYRQKVRGKKDDILEMSLRVVECRFAWSHAASRCIVLSHCYFASTHSHLAMSSVGVSRNTYHDTDTAKRQYDTAHDNAKRYSTSRNDIFKILWLTLLE